MAEKAGNITKLAQMAWEHIVEADITITAAAENMGISRTLLSRYLNGTYDKDPTNIENTLKAYLERETGIKADAATQKPQVRKRGDMLKTRDARAIAGICEDAQRQRRINVAVGRSGYGKTYALRKFAENNKRVAYIECDATMGCQDLVEALARALGVKLVSGSIHSKLSAIRSYLNAFKGHLLIVDEADKLISKQTQTKMEILRGIFDQSEVGLVIAGEERLEVNLQTYLDRMANRVSLCISLQGLTGDEVEEYLSGYDMDEDAMRELKNRATGTGCFRLFDRTMEAVIQLLNMRGETRITLSVVREASYGMLL